MAPFDFIPTVSSVSPANTVHWNATSSKHRNRNGVCVCVKSGSEALEYVWKRNAGRMKEQRQTGIVTTEVIFMTYSTSSSLFRKTGSEIKTDDPSSNIGFLVTLCCGQSVTMRKTTHLSPLTNWSGCCCANPLTSQTLNQPTFSQWGHLPKNWSCEYTASAWKCWLLENMHEWADTGD